MQKDNFKAILNAIMPDIPEAAGSIQLCAGQQAGSEAAMHAMHQICNDPDSQAGLLVDATNAFNCLIRKVYSPTQHPFLVPISCHCSN